MNNLHQKKRFKYFPLTDKELKELSERDSCIILRKNCEFHLKLNYSALPVGSLNFQKNVADELNKRILKYSSELNDLILRFCNPRTVSPVEANLCHKLNVTCIADVYIFKPQRNCILTATVNKISKNHIGCILYKVFNVSIIKPTDLPFNQWAGQKVQLNDIVTFKIIKLDISEVIPYIVGELVHENDDNDDDDDDYCTHSRENDERDSGIGADHSSQITSDEKCSDLDDLLEKVKDVKSKKRKRSNT
ncbi:hypothetical protein PGB90_010000 [Kerria lacca]